MNEDDLIEKFFGEENIYNYFPDLALSDSIIKLSAIIQIICNILVNKKIITKEEYLKLFTDKEINEIIKKFKELGDKE